MPDLTAVICTYNRPDLLRRALAGVEAQDFAGTIETIIVFDKSDPDTSLERSDRATARAHHAECSHVRAAGRAQHRVRRAPPHRSSRCATTTTRGRRRRPRISSRCSTEQPEIDVVFGGIRAMTDTRARRCASPTPTASRFPMLLASRVAHAHISSAMFRKDALFDRIGLFDEVIPGGYSEDYEWTLRAARNGPMAIVREPLVDVRWGTGSYYKDRWHTIDEALGYLLEKYPGVRDQSARPSARAKASRRSRGRPARTSAKHGR